MQETNRKAGWPSHLTRRSLVAMCGFALTIELGRAARAEQPPHLTKVICLTPAPMVVPGLEPYVIAKHNGYYAEEGLDVQFITVQGGVEGAKQVGVGNADFSIGMGDTSAIVRSNGVPVKVVAVVGGGGLTQLVSRADRHINSPADLKGKTVTVISYGDTTYYALLGMLASVGLTKADVKIEAAGPTGVWQLVANGQADAMAGIPGWGIEIEDHGVKVNWIEAQKYFPAMAQAILASDKTIAERPDLMRGFVKASLRGIQDIVKDPESAANDYIAAEPQLASRKDYVVRVLKANARLEYGQQKTIGEMNSAALQKLTDFYASYGIIAPHQKLSDLYTNKFVE